MSYHVISCHIISCHVMSCHVISCHVMSCHAISYHIMSCHVISYHVVSYPVISYSISLSSAAFMRRAVVLAVRGEAMVALIDCFPPSRTILGGCKPRAFRRQAKFWQKTWMEYTFVFVLCVRAFGVFVLCAPLAFLRVWVCERVPLVLQPIFVACVVLCWAYFVCGGVCAQCSQLMSVKAQPFRQNVSPPLIPTYPTDFLRCPYLRPPPRSDLATKIQGRQLSASPAAGATGNTPSSHRAASLPSSLSLTISPRSPSLAMGRGGHPPGMHTGETPEGF